MYCCGARLVEIWKSGLTNRRAEPATTPLVEPAFVKSTMARQARPSMALVFAGWVLVGTKQPVFWRRRMREVGPLGSLRCLNGCCLHWNETERVRKGDLGLRHSRLGTLGTDGCLHECWIFSAERHSCGTRGRELNSFCRRWAATHLGKMYREKQFHRLAAFGTERSRLLGQCIRLVLRRESGQT